MLFTASKLGWQLLAPGNLLLLLAAAGTVLLWTRGARLGRILVSLSILGFGLIAALPLDAWLARPLEERFQAASALPDKVDGIIVLAGEIDPEATAYYGQPILNDAAERVTTLVALGRRFPEAKLVYAGGSGRIGGGLSAAEQVQPLLRSLGLDPARVEFEKDSRNTFESALALAQHLRPAENDRWLLVTSAQHMPRSMGAFRRAGLRVQPYQVDYRFGPAAPTYWSFDLSGNLARLSSAVYEWVGLLIYRALGRTGEVFPSP